MPTEREFHMKGDFTRETFDPRRHYNGVRMQQGRVQLDADWNEQLDIAAHLHETGTGDLIGHCGAPLHDAGFAIAASVAALPAAQQAAAAALPFASGDLFISAGRYYVDGILCENEAPVLAGRQPDLPPGAAIVAVDDNAAVALPPAPGVYLVYLDVWNQHLTAIEAPHVRETALGGPDTATRTKTVWQVKLVRAGAAGANVHCLTQVSLWESLIAPPSGRLSARAEPGAVSDKPCIVAPGAGYRRLENQLYRVEVHKSGTLGNATFKWSRDNGSILTRWEQKNGNDLIVSSAGRDKFLGFAAGQWIELTDDGRDQLGQSGTLVQLVKVEGKVLTIDPLTATGPVDILSFPQNAKIRRWDSAGEIKIETPAGNAGFLPLESGVEVKFTAGNYRAGDYWLIPARTATGNVEWPVDPLSGDPVPTPPRGIKHHYCRLAVARFDAGQWTVLSECRELFPPVTELTSLHYVGGDGQEMAPDPTRTLWLCGPLQVRVRSGGVPVEGAKVQFRILEPQPPGTAALASLDLAQTGVDLTVATDALGLAACRWRLDADAANVCQRASATLLDRATQPLAHQQVVFTGRLDLLSGVGEPDLTRIVAISWRHGGSEADLFPIHESVGDAVAGVGFVIAFSDAASVPAGRYDHALEVLIPTPMLMGANPGRVPGGGPTFTLVDLPPQTIYQCWCPLLTGHDTQGRPLARIAPVTCKLDGPSIVRAELTTEKAANGVAFLMQPNSITDLLVNKAALFDQFQVRLRCDFVVDRQGRAVDGEFLRARLPSGDRPAASTLGIQGGLFESWFAFRGSFRGGHMVPVIDDSRLTVTVVSLWRKTKATMPVLFASVDGGPPQFMTAQLAQPDVVADPRFDVRVSSHALMLTPGRSQTIDIRWEGPHRISHVPNVNLGGFVLNSRIMWKGAPAGVTHPIALDLRELNVNVVRGQAYRAKLAASSPSQLRLAFDLELVENIKRLPPGLKIDADAGLMVIDEASTKKYADNPHQPGGDMAFCGTVRASDGSFVQFEGMFDGVEPIL
jgi:hypothetical protein